MPSLIITSIGGIISGLAAWLMPKSFWIIIAGRLIQGIGASGAFPVVIPTVGDMFKEDADVSKGLGIIETSNTFGKVVSPILGAALAAILWFIPFFAISFFAIISVFLVAFLVKTPNEKDKEENDNFRVFVKKTKDILKKEGRWLSGIFSGGFITTFILFGLLFFFFFSFRRHSRHKRYSTGSYCCHSPFNPLFHLFYHWKNYWKRKILNEMDNSFWKHISYNFPYCFESLE